MATGSCRSDPSPKWTTYSDSPSSNPDVVPRRARGELTDDERRKLEHQGVPRDCHHDDLSIMKARYEVDKECTVVGVESSDAGRGLTCEDVKKQIASLMNNTDKGAVVIHYIGPGKKNTGDWCFSDGFITFRELLDIYMNNHLFRGRVLSIVSDCSYSGSWVKECMQFMDEQGVGPCGHVAKEKGILVQVFASCQSNEIPIEFVLAIHAFINDKNTKKISPSCDFRTAAAGEGQHPSGIDFNTLRCENKNIDDPCTMAPGSTWQKWSVGDRVRPFTSKDNIQPTWSYVLLVDDDQTICSIIDKNFTGDLADYGQFLRTGLGEEPPIEVNEWIEKNYKVDYKYIPQ